MAKFKIDHPGTVRGECTRALLARMWNHDNRVGFGGYHIKREDMKRLRDVLGAESENVLHDAGFKQHPKHKHQYWTNSRSPYGDEAKLPFRPPYDLLQVIVATYGENPA